MTSTQYEELCRRYVAATFNVALASVVSRDEPHPRRPGNAEFDHQIDLWWETGDASVEYLHIANAKWRGPNDKVDQPDVLLLEQVRSAVNAHKAVMLTNTDFTAGARAAADAYRIALHVVRPEFDTSTLPVGSSSAVRAEVVTALDVVAAGSQGSPLYSFSVVHRGLEIPSGREVAGAPPGQGAIPFAPVHGGPVVQTTSGPPVTNRGPGTIPSVNRTMTGASHQGGGGTFRKR